MPNLVFILLASTLAGGAYLIDRRRKLEEEKALAAVNIASPQAAKTEIKELGWDDVMPVDAIGLEVGYRLIPLVDRNQGGQLMMRIKGVRKKLSQELGFLIPSVHIRDNLDLAPTEYRISLMGVSVGEANIMPEKEMAINPGRVFGNLPGTPCRDPAFGLDAVWIEASQKDQAQTLAIPWSIRARSSPLISAIFCRPTPTSCSATKRRSSYWITWPNWRRSWSRIWCRKPCRWACW